MAFIVNGEYVGDELLFQEFRHLGGDRLNPRDAEAPQKIETLQRAAEEHVLNRTLLRQMALQQNFGVSAEEVEAERLRRWGSSSNTICGTGVFRAIEAELLVARMCAALTKHVLRPTRVEVERFYHANPKRFYQSERVHAAHIIKNVDRPEVEPEARAILVTAAAELDSGRSFAKVADRYSDCGGVGGSLGWIARGEMVEEFDQVVFALQEGERSAIFPTIFGLHIGTVLGRKPAGIQPFEEIRQPLARSLFEESRQAAIELAVAAAARRSTITVP